MAPGPDLSIYLFLITAFFSFLYLYRSGLDLGNHSNLFHWVDSGLQHVATFLAWLIPPGLLCRCHPGEELWILGHGREVVLCWVGAALSLLVSLLNKKAVLCCSEGD